MGLSAIYESLTPEEMAIEYQVRGLATKQVGVEATFLGMFSKECQNMSSKPKLSHIVKEPGTELNEIKLVMPMMDEMLDQLEDNSTFQDKQKALFKICHWRDRAERLRNSFSDLNGIDLACNALSRAARYLSRDLKRWENKEMEKEKPRWSQPSTSGGVTNLNSGGQKIQEQGERSGQNCSVNEAERRFSNQIEELTRSVIEQLHTSSRASKKDKPKGRKHQTSIRYDKSDSDDSDCSESTSGSSYSTAQRQLPTRHYKSPNIRYQRNSHPSKWKIMFSGKTDRKREDDNVHDFIMKLEEHAIQDGVKRNQLVSLSRHFVTEKAEKWYYIFIRKNRDASWKQFKEAILERFSSVEGDRAMRRYLRHRIQYPKETFNDFLLEIESVNGRLPNPLPDEEILELLLDNMNPALKSSTVNMKFTTVDGLRKVCDNLEKLWHTSGFDPRRLIETRIKRNTVVEEVREFQTAISSDLGNARKLKTSVNDLKSDEQDSNYEEPTLNSNVCAIDRSMFVMCWNCKDLGHTFTACSIDRTHQFCEGCGLPNVAKLDCLRCQKRRVMMGNRLPNVSTGEFRSEKVFNPRYSNPRTSK